MPYDYVSRSFFGPQLTTFAPRPQPVVIRTNLDPAVRSLIMCVWNDKPALNVLKTWLWTRVYYLQTAKPFNWRPENNDLISVAYEIERRLAQL